MRISDWSSDVCSSDLLAGPARAAAGVPGPAKNHAAMTLNARAEGEAGRITQKINKNLKPQDYFGAEDAFLDRLRTNANDLYGEAYRAGQHLESKTLSSLLERPIAQRSEEHTSELPSLMRISYAVFCLNKKNIKHAFTEHTI